MDRFVSLSRHQAGESPHQLWRRAQAVRLRWVFVVMWSWCTNHWAAIWIVWCASQDFVLWPRPHSMQMMWVDLHSVPFQPHVLCVSARQQQVVCLSLQTLSLSAHMFSLFLSGNVTKHTHAHLLSFITEITSKIFYVSVISHLCSDLFHLNMNSNEKLYSSVFVEHSWEI